MEVYTGYGDKGMTDLSHTKNVSKSDDRICLMGSVEELMSHIGLVRVLIDDVDVVRMLEKISETLKKIIDGVSDPYNREFKVSEDRTELPASVVMATRVMVTSCGTMGSTDRAKLSWTGPRT